MPRWNEDMEACPRGQSVIILAWWYRQPASPFVCQAYRDRDTGQWKWDRTREPVLHWEGGNFCEPTGWCELPKATPRQLRERRGMR